MITHIWNGYTAVSLWTNVHTVCLFMSDFVTSVTGAIKCLFTSTFLIGMIGYPAECAWSVVRICLVK